MHKYIIFCGLTLVLMLNCQAQEIEAPRLSPLEVISMRYDDTYVKIVYSKPAMKGREIFGSLVPYGEVWRTGANEAAEITTTKDILIANDTLYSGTYSIFTIPEKDKWTIIFNSDLGLWGAYNYRQELDVLRIEVIPSSTSEAYEHFTIEFLKKGLQETEVAFRWANTSVYFPLEFIRE